MLRRMYSTLATRTIVILLVIGISVAGFLGFMFMDHAHTGHQICINDRVENDNFAPGDSASCAKLHLNLVYEITQVVPVQSDFTKTLAAFLFSTIAALTLWLVGHIVHAPLAAIHRGSRADDGVFQLFRRLRHWLALFEKRDPLRRFFGAGRSVARRHSSR